MLPAIMRTGWVRTALLIAWPLALFVLIQADGLYPVLRLEGAATNQIVGAASFLLPFLALKHALNVPRYTLTKVAVTIALMPLLFASIFAGFVEVYSASEVLLTGSNPTFELLARTSMDGYSVAAYRTNCGAPCSFGVYLLQERPIFPGVLLVRALDSFDSADGASFEKLGGNRLRVNVRKYSSSHTAVEAHDFELDPWIYF